MKRELGIFTYRDLLFHFPFRYIDKTRFHKIRDIQNEGENYQIRGIIRRLEVLGEGRAKRLTATLRDDTGAIELVWFQSMAGRALGGVPPGTRGVGGGKSQRTNFRPALVLRHGPSSAHWLPRRHGGGNPLPGNGMPGRLLGYREAAGFVTLIGIAGGGGRFRGLLGRRRDLDALLTRLTYAFG